MQQELRFGLVGITDKKRFGPIMSNFLGQFFQVFIGKKKERKKEKHCSVGTKKLNKMKLIFFVFLKNKKYIFFQKFYTLRNIFNCVLLH